jgi:hypothetical protein
MSVVLNVITFELITPDTVFTVLFPRDVTPNRLVYCAIVSKELGASIFKEQKVLEM